LPGKTAAPHEIPYGLETDEPPSLEAASRPQAEQVHKRLNEIAPKQITGVAEKQLLIANASGVVTAVTASGDVTNDKAGVFTIGPGAVTASKLAVGSALANLASELKGDATLAKDGTLTLANQAHFFSTAELTRTSTALGSFSTAIKVELPKVTADQAIEILFRSFILGGTVTTPPIPRLALIVGGTNVLESPESVFNENLWFRAFSNGGAFGAEKVGAGAEAEAKTEAAKTTTLLLPGAPWHVKHKTGETAPLSIEIQGKVASGTVKLQGAYLAARVIG
jgi:hypothetical protein